jgi:hypothetical protein
MWLINLNHSRCVNTRLRIWSSLDMRFQVLMATSMNDAVRRAIS